MSDAATIYGAVYGAVLAQKIADANDPPEAMRWAANSAAQSAVWDFKEFAKTNSFISVDEQP